MTRRTQRPPMVRGIALLAAALLAACARPVSPPTAATPTAAPGPTPIPNTAPFSGDVLVVAQGGGGALAPENTLGAFANAVRMGVDMVGCDAHLSRDGAVVVIRDPDIARTTDGTGLVNSLTLAELRELNAAAKFAGRWPAEPVPSLAEVLDAVQGRVGVQIEIKMSKSLGRYPAIEEKVIGLVAKREMVGQVTIVSSDFATLADVKRIEPGIKTGTLAGASWMAARAGKAPEQIVDEVIQGTGADCFMPCAGSVSTALVQAAHARGLTVGTWAVDAPEDMLRLAGYGVDLIATNRPDELLRLLGR